MTYRCQDCGIVVIPTLIPPRVSAVRLCPSCYQKREKSVEEAKYGEAWDNFRKAGADFRKAWEDFKKAEADLEKATEDNQQAKTEEA